MNEIKKIDVSVDANELKSIQDLFYIGMARKIEKLLSKDGGVQVNIGAGNGSKIIKNTISIDYPEWDAETMPLPYEDNSIDVYHCYHFLEHIKNVKNVFFEFQRTLKPGGYVNIVVPYYSSQLAYITLDHISFFSEKTIPRLLHENTYNNGGNIDLQVHTQFIIGIVERNMALFCQVKKV